MKWLWSKVGVMLFWLTWPLLWVKLRNSRRTRVLVVCETEILVVKLWLGDGRWSFPGGGLHAGEEANSGAKRELAEETGINLPIRKFQKLDTHKDSFRGLTFTADRFVVNLSQKPKIRPQLGEIIDIAWVPINESVATGLRSDARDLLEVWRHSLDLLP